MKQAILSLLVIGLSVLLGCKTTDGGTAGDGSAGTRPAAYSEKHLPPPIHLTPDMRAAVKRTMSEHGDDLTMLLWSILFLDLDSASEWAKSIAARPPMTPNKDENLRIPPQLLVLGSQLHEQATKMSELSRQPERDSEAFAKAFGELAETCVRCHSVYLYDRGETPSVPAATTDQVERPAQATP